jgi:hypothetical protein
LEQQRTQKATAAAIRIMWQSPDGELVDIGGSPSDAAVTMILTGAAPLFPNSMPLCEGFGG